MFNLCSMHPLLFYDLFLIEFFVCWEGFLIEIHCLFYGSIAISTLEFWILLSFYS